ncbi:MAG TPA: nicotinate-nucleotide adenylyltransferase [Candidatus Limnocylindria bacterium]|nr:nicotinate-nucleotide adenylyltransferase [Candidatus Limnocylindria bacterium]
MPGGIGIFGGTFDPVHLGHLRAAEDVREALELAEIRFVPAAVPPHKDAQTVTAPAARLRMLELATEGVPGFRVWPVELERQGLSYSVDTIRALRAEVGDARPIAFVLGRDAFAEFDTWKEYTTIFTLCDVVVITRPPQREAMTMADIPVAARGAFCYDSASGSFHHESGHRVIPLSVVSLDISATDIRARLAAGRSIRFLVPAAVEAYLESTRLYRPAHAS